MKRLSMFSDALCAACGEPAAEGLADSYGLWCETHGRIRAVSALESACFYLLRTFPREFDATIAAVRPSAGDPLKSHSQQLAATAHVAEGDCATKDGSDDDGGVVLGSSNR